MSTAINPYYTRNELDRQFCNENCRKGERHEQFILIIYTLAIIEKGN
jgi:hypothetical protein